MHASRRLALVLLLSFGFTGIAPAYPVFANAGAVAEVKEAPQHPGIVFHQYYLGCLSQASYLIGDEKSKTAVVIDPQRDVDQYIADAEKHGLKITHVFLTHVHADFVAGHLELQRRTGAKICLGEGTKASYKFASFKDGDALDLGDLRLKVLATPGHTPEAISVLVYDLKQDKKDPYAVLTGDCLFIGDVGRPDLLASSGVTAEQLAGMMYDSLHDKLMKLPDQTLVYPAHGAGSLCGKNMSKETVSTIGQEKKSNYALQPMSKEKLVAMLTKDQPKAPKYFSYDASYNLRKHNMLDDVVAKGCKPLKVEQAIQKKNAGAYLLDGRESSAYAESHAIDTVNIPLNGRYAMWAGALLDHEKPVVLIADPGQEKLATVRLGRIGFDNVVGYVDGGMKAFDGEYKDMVRSNVRETPATLAKRMKTDNPPVVLDVRNDTEWADAHIDGTMHVPLIDIYERLDALPKNKEVVVLCATGNRSSTAASVLAQHGITQVTDLAGGIEAWMKDALPVNKGAAACTTKAPKE